MDMQQIIAWILQGGGAGIIAYWIIERWTWAVALNPEPRQYVAWIISGALGIGAWGLSLWFGLQAVPATPQAWSEAIVGAVLLAIMGAKLVHTRKRLSRYARNGAGERVEKHRGIPWPPAS